MPEMHRNRSPSPEMSEMMSIQYTKCLKDLKLRSRVLQFSMQITENVQSTVYISSTCYSSFKDIREGVCKKSCEASKTIFCFKRKKLNANLNFIIRDGEIL
jgi:hypothetical protein